jgi:hypothetical protein
MTGNSLLMVNLPRNHMVNASEFSSQGTVGYRSAARICRESPWPSNGGCIIFRKKISERKTAIRLLGLNHIIICLYGWIGGNPPGLSVGSRNQNEAAKHEVLVEKLFCQRAFHTF